MASITDNLSPPQTPSRVFYSLGRMLGVDDFQADQDYHRGALARALLQLCGTGTVMGLNVVIPQAWQPGTSYAKWAFVYDASQNVQVNTGSAGISGSSVSFGANAGDTVDDGASIVWTNQGPLKNTVGDSVWKPNTSFSAPVAIVDANGNVQVLTAPDGFTSGGTTPMWSTTVGSTTNDGAPAIAAWTCVGAAQLEVEVTAGMAIDRVGRAIESPSTVCIYLEPWMAGQSVSDLNSALHGGNILIDVFATFKPCTQGVTPCFATQDDYDATDAFSANRLVDSFAMQLVLRTDANPLLPQDPWLAAGVTPGASVDGALTQRLKQALLMGRTGAGASSPFSVNGATPSEYPPAFDASSVFLARISIPATAVPGMAPTYDLNTITIDNLSRLFLYPTSLVARAMGLSSGAEI